MIRKLVMAGLLLTGCSLSIAPPNTPAPIASPTPTSVDNTDTWTTLAPGLERRDYLPNPDNELSKLTALRIDPAYYSFRIHYHPGAPLTIRQWEAELVGAAAFINANFFDPNYEILGLLVSDGIVHGESYTDRGGMFAVENGTARVRSTFAEPYMGEALEQAAQAFPMLVFNGQQAYTDTTTDRFTRRTVIGQDREGRIILMATPLIGPRYST